MPSFKTQGLKKVKASASVASDSSDSNYDSDNSYCIFLHVVEGINFHLREVRDFDGQGGLRSAREKVIMNAVLNGIQFEVEGTSTVASETTIFNSNCVWEVDLAGLKQLKTDNRPVKLVFFIVGPTVEQKVIGNLLLPLRGLPIISAEHTANIKMLWHKLSCLGNEWRSQKPEIYLTLALVKKSLLKNTEFECLMGITKKSARSNAIQTTDNSATSSMLQSHSNIYVQQMVQLGLLQVGNDPLVDCDIIEVVLYLKELKNINKLIRSTSGREHASLPIIVKLDFVGNVTTVDLAINDRDGYFLSEKLGLRFKTSLKSLRLYFQRIFYLPINIFYNGNALANCSMDFGKLLPDDSYFDVSTSYKREGAFFFDRFCRNISGRDVKPSLEYKFTVELQAINSRKPVDHTKLLLEYKPSSAGASALAQVVAGSDAQCEWNSTANLRRIDVPRPYGQTLSSSNMQKVEEIETNEKVAAWCEEVIKTHQQMVQSQQASKSANERASSWPATDELTTQVVDPAPPQPVSSPVPLACAPSKECVIEPPQEFLIQRRSDMAINTEPVTVISNDMITDYHLNVVRELEDWKYHEMQQFELELKRKEMLYLKNLEDQLLLKSCIDQTELSTNISKCSEFEERLHDLRNSIRKTTQEKNTQTEYAHSWEKANREIKEKYQKRFDDLEYHITRLKSEMEQQLQKFQARHIEMQEENMQLVQDKVQLMERLGKLETQLANMKQQGASDAADLQKMLNELCLQNERYGQMEKAKEFYKSQWRRCAQRMHKLKLAMLEKKETELQAQTERSVNFNIRDVISGKSEASDDDDEISFEYESNTRRKARAKAMYSGASTSTTTSETSSVDYVPSLSNDSTTNSC